MKFVLNLLSGNGANKKLNFRFMKNGVNGTRSIIDVLPGVLTLFLGLGTPTRHKETIDIQE